MQTVKSQTVLISAMQIVNIDFFSSASMDSFLGHESSVGAISDVLACTAKAARMQLRLWSIE